MIPTRCALVDGGTEEVGKSGEVSGRASGAMDFAFGPLLRFPVEREGTEVEGGGIRF